MPKPYTPNDAPESCQSCGAGNQELYWQADFELWDCADCFAEASMLVEAEATCPVLYEEVNAGNKSVAQIADIMADHECAVCCAHKAIAAAVAAEERAA